MLQLPAIEDAKDKLFVSLRIRKSRRVPTGKDGIAIECISARLLKARISIQSTFVTFVVAYAPTEDATEGEKDKHMAALNLSLIHISEPTNS